MGEQRVTKEFYKFCTHLAKDYYNLIERRRQIEKEILYGSCGPSDGMPHSTGTGDPTAIKAEKLIQEKREVDYYLGALQSAFQKLPDEWCMKLIRNNLFRFPPITMECLQHKYHYPMSLRTMKTIRHNYIADVARELMKKP